METDYDHLGNCEGCKAPCPDSKLVMHKIKNEDEPPSDWSLRWLCPKCTAKKIRYLVRIGS